MSAHKAVFLVNPASDNGATGRRWPEIAHRAATGGLKGDALFSDAPGQLGTLARGAVDDGATLLVVVGGDGSVNEVANGVAGLDGVELAVIARGTGWDFIRTYGIPHDVASAVDVALNGTARTIDLGRVTYLTWAGDEAVAWFANIASTGMSGAIAQRANETTKALGGKASYLFATLAVFAGWDATDIRVSVDDEIRGGRMHDVIVANGRYFGGGMMICPDASPDDGRFDAGICRTRRPSCCAARRSPSTRTSRCRSSSTASSRARRRRASSSSPARSACAFPSRDRARSSCERCSSCGPRRSSSSTSSSAQSSSCVRSTCRRACRPSARAPRAAARGSRDRAPASATRRGAP
ncbi:MAG: YegS/Rv2252/BmrU family lipid kinase [Actinobacteria bacterium]|nr:MAG: YegS/Rv2252/BmrU family lipid kinase [Actinomycetota bacterium]